MMTSRMYLREIYTYKNNAWPCGKPQKLVQYSYGNDPDKPFGSSRCSFDELGALILETYYNTEGSKLVSSTYKYDVSNCLAEVISIFHSVNKKSVTRYTLKPVENIIEESIHYEEGFTTSMIFMLDSCGRIAGMYKKGKSQNIEVADRDVSGRIISKSTENCRGEVVSRVIMEYTDSGESVHLFVKKYPGDIIVESIYRSFTYDAHGNWIRKNEEIPILDGQKGVYKGTYCTFRELTYYDFTGE